MTRFVAALCLIATACGQEEAAFVLDEEELAGIRQAFEPLPDVAESADNALTPEKVALGRALFLDEALSNPAANAGQRISCNTCHLLDAYGVDGLPRSVGILGTEVPVNAPTVYNAALHFRQFWDGRAADVEAQALGPITAVPEMGFTDSLEDQQTVLDQLVATDDSYVDRFDEAFGPDSFTFHNIGQAIGAFERTLLTPSPFDAFLKGDTEALSDAEQRGLKVFMGAGGIGCVSCHNGVAVGGGVFRNLGEGVPMAHAGDSLAEAAFSDVPMPLKVPSLRNIAETGPYFHNGSVDSLDEAVRIMAEYQLGVALSGEESADLLAFLGSLTGTLPQ